MQLTDDYGVDEKNSTGVHTDYVAHSFWSRDELLRQPFDANHLGVSLGTENGDSPLL